MLNNFTSRNVFATVRPDMPPTSFWLRNCVTLHVRNVAMWSVVYLAMSALLFLQGWYETYVFALAFVGISISICVGYAVGGGELALPEEEDGWRVRVVDAVQLVLMAFLTGGCLYGTGVAGGVETHPDFEYFRNACYHNLIDAPWPVVLPNGKEMTYYIAGMTVPAMLSRMFSGEDARQWCLLIWSSIPLFLALLLLQIRMKKVSWLLVLIALFFCTPFDRECAVELLKRAHNALCYYAFGADWQLPVMVGRFHASGINAPALLAVSAPVLVIALIVTMPGRQGMLVPFLLALLAAISPIGAISIFPLALFAYIRAFIREGCPMWRYGVWGLFPVLLACCWLVYFARSQSDVYVGLCALNWRNWPAFWAYYLPSQILFIVLTWHLLKRRKNNAWIVPMWLVTSLIPVFYIGSRSDENCLLGCNELWFKGVGAYVLLLAYLVVQEWKALPVWVRIGWLLCSILGVYTLCCSYATYESGRKINDNLNGHLCHDLEFLNQSCPPTLPPGLPGVLLRKNGESEQLFPGNILPKAPGCDYSRPMLHN